MRIFALELSLLIETSLKFIKLVHLMEQISLYITRFVYTIHSIEVHYKELEITLGLCVVRQIRIFGTQYRKFTLWRVTMWKVDCIRNISLIFYDL